MYFFELGDSNGRVAINLDLVTAIMPVGLEGTMFFNAGEDDGMQVDIPYTVVMADLRGRRLIR